jgi:hypothetical protein
LLCKVHHGDLDSDSQTEYSFKVVEMGWGENSFCVQAEILQTTDKAEILDCSQLCTFIMSLMSRVGHVVLKSASPQIFFCCAATQT